MIMHVYVPYTKSVSKSYKAVLQDGMTGQTGFYFLGRWVGIQNYEIYHV